MSNSNLYEKLIEEIDRKSLPKHIAIIMDGNGRWANQRGLPRIAGHNAGIGSVRDIATCCRELGVSVLTLYAFSKENWQRPAVETKTLMFLLEEFLQKELDTLMKNEIRLRAIGRLDDLPKSVKKWLDKTIEKTKHNDKMQMVLALSYSGRVEIIDAVKKIARKVKNDIVKEDDIDENIVSEHLYTNDFADPDLLIRTSGETRISNFLLWQLAYTELIFTKTPWPDFKRVDLVNALLEYQNRERRFGLVSPPDGGSC